MCGHERPAFEFLNPVTEVLVLQPRIGIGSVTAETFQHLALVRVETGSRLVRPIEGDRVAVLSTGGRNGENGQLEVCGEPRLAGPRVSDAKGRPFEQFLKNSVIEFKLAGRRVVPANDRS